MKGLSVVVVVCMVWTMVLRDVAVVLSEEASFPGAEKISIAVMELTPRGRSAQEIGVLSDRLRIELMITERFDMTTREQMDRIFEEQRFQLSGFCDETACLVEAGKIIGVRKMVGGSVGKIGDLYSVSVFMVDVETAQMSQPVKTDYSGKVEGLMEVMKCLARQLAGLPCVPPKPFYKKWWFWGLAVGGIGGGTYYWWSQQQTDTVGIRVRW